MTTTATKTRKPRTTKPRAKKAAPVAAPAPIAQTEPTPAPIAQTQTPTAPTAPAPVLRWIRTRYTGTCADCGRALNAGIMVQYNAAKGTLHCEYHRMKSNATATRTPSGLPLVPAGQIENDERPDQHERNEVERQAEEGAAYADDGEGTNPEDMPF